MIIDLLGTALDGDYRIVFYNNSYDIGYLSRGETGRYLNWKISTIVGFNIL